MAALFLIFLLVASGGAAVGHDWASLQLRGIPDSGGQHASDVPPKGPLMDIMTVNGCGSFATLLAATRNASEIFEQRIVDGGLTVFCPDDHAVAAYEPKFTNLGADDQLAVLLLHGAEARYGRSQIAAFHWVAVSTLAANAATNERLVLTVRDDGDTVRLWPSSGSGSGGAAMAARVTKAISSDDSRLAVYVVDAVLLPSHVRQVLDGGDEAAACGGYLGWLHGWLDITLTVRQWLLLTAGIIMSRMVAILFGWP